LSSLPSNPTYTSYLLPFLLLIISLCGIFFPRARKRFPCSSHLINMMTLVLVWGQEIRSYVFQCVRGEHCGGGCCLVSVCSLRSVGFRLLCDPLFISTLGYYRISWWPPRKTHPFEVRIIVPHGTSFGTIFQSVVPLQSL